jgi:phospholipid/cholesterol/gamma-HCH transport system permease protein
MRFAQRREQLNEAIDATARAAWEWLRGFILETGEYVIFGSAAVRLFFSRPFRARELIEQVEFIGNKSIGIICMTGLFTGMAISYQLYLGFKIVNATSLVGSTVALGISRELGPVLTGLIIAARAGGAMAARLGTMRVTEQIDALEVMGVEPRQYLVSPRVVAAVIATPLLTGVFDAAATVGSYFLCIRVLGMDEAQFINGIVSWIKPNHINEGLFKAAIFGFFFAVICTQRGFNTKGGAEGVGRSTNEGVVMSMVLIIALDFFTTNLIHIFYGVFYP